MKVHQIYTESSLRNFTYLLEDGNGSITCIDPYSTELVMDYLESLEGSLEVIINTHEHGDHTGGNQGLQNATGCKIWAHQNAKGKIPNIDRFLSGGESIPLGTDHQLKVLDTPGHTFAHLCLMLEEKGTMKAIFTGDTLFNAGVGNCHNGGDPEVLFKTIHEQFQNLPDDVLVYPGHDYLFNNLKFTLDREPSNVTASELLDNETLATDKKTDDVFLVSNMALERKMNTFLRLDNEEIKRGLSDLTLDKKQVFLKLRQLRNNW